MKDNISRQLLDRIEKTLKESANEVLTNNSSRNYDDLEQEMIRKVNAKITSLSRNLSLKLPTCNETEVKNVSCQSSKTSNGIIKGSIIIEHCEKRNIQKYGGPGYPGKEDGQLCVYPEHSKTFYKWNSSLCKWRNIYDSIDRGNNKTQSWYDKLTNNAAFEPWWGNNPGMDGIKSDRKRNGADDLWGDPGVRKFGSSFKQISANIMESIYNFTYDFRAVLKHYIKIKEALSEKTTPTDIKNKNNQELKISPKDTVTYSLEAKYIDVISNKHYNGFRKDIKGYNKAKKDSIYHTNRSDASVRIEVKISEKY